MVGLPWLPPCAGIRASSTSTLWHLIPSSSIGDEFKLMVSYYFYLLLLLLNLVTIVVVVVVVVVVVSQTYSSLIKLSIPPVSVLGEMESAETVQH